MSNLIHKSEAIAAGFTIDEHAAGRPLAYKGDRFRPTETRACYTDLESALLQCKKAIPPDALCLYEDGEDWYAVFGDFQNLQESPSGHGKTWEEAVIELGCSGIRGGESRARAFWQVLKFCEMGEHHEVGNSRLGIAMRNVSEQFGRTAASTVRQ